MDDVVYNRQLNKYVARTLASGVKPFEIALKPLIDCNYGEVRGYAAELIVKSVVCGTLTPDDVFASSAEDGIKTSYSLRAIGKAADASAAIAAAGKRHSFVSVRVSDTLLTNGDPYNALKDAVGGSDADVALEFDADVTQIESARLADAFSSIRAAKIKVTVNGYGGDNFSIEKLLSACPDFVITAKKTAELTVDTEKATAVAPMLNFVKSLGGSIIAGGIDNDAELREFRARDAFAFFASDKYKGNFAGITNITSLDAVLAAGGSDD